MTKTLKTLLTASLFISISACGDVDSLKNDMADGGINSKKYRAISFLTRTKQNMQDPDYNWVDRCEKRDMIANRWSMIGHLEQAGIKPTITGKTPCDEVQKFVLTVKLPKRDTGK